MMVPNTNVRTIISSAGLSNAQKKPSSERLYRTRSSLSARAQISSLYRYVSRTNSIMNESCRRQLLCHYHAFLLSRPSQPTLAVILSLGWLQESETQTQKL